MVKDIEIDGCWDFYMITLFYLENGVRKQERFNVPREDFIKVENLLKEQGYKWYVVDNGTRNYNPDQLTLDFGEVR